MRIKFIACDLITAKSGRTYILELCPALACRREDKADMLVQSMAHNSAKLDNGLVIVQAPQVLIGKEGVLDHYSRDAQRILTYSSTVAGKADRLMHDHAKANLELVPKDKVRQYINRVIKGEKKFPHRFWVMYFRDGAEHTATADRFSILLRNLFKKMGKDIVPFDAYPLAVACEQDKVLFWQFLLLVDSSLCVSKEIFKFSTFDIPQKTKLANFIKDLPNEKFIIKPINANLTSGMLVVSRDKLVQLIELVVKFLKEPEISVKKAFGVFALQTDFSAEAKIKALLYPDLASLSLLINDLVTVEVKKFINYWTGLDEGQTIGSERDFFLVEAYIQPKPEVLATGEGSQEIAVANRGFLLRSDKSPKPSLLNLVAKANYKKSMIGDDVDFVSSTRNYYSVIFGQIEKKYPNLCHDYIERDDSAKEKVNEALAESEVWIEVLLTKNVSEFLAEVTERNKDNPELLQYLDSESVKELNLEKTGFCWHCFKIAMGLKICSRCKIAEYCNSDCQRADWNKYHKTECTLINNGE